MKDVPEPVAQIAEVMRGFTRPWYVFGGWAVDSWLGEQTRKHDDVNIAIFNEDGIALREHLPDWTLVAHEAGGYQRTSRRCCRTWGKNSAVGCAKPYRWCPIRG